MAQATIRSFAEPAADEFRERVKAWLTAAIPRDWAERRIESLPFAEAIDRRRQWDRLVWSGNYAGITWPQEYGGLGLGPIEELIFYQEAAAAHAPDTANSIGINLAGPVIMDCGTDAQKQRFLTPILSGQTLWCEGFSEPNAGSDLASLTTRARKVDDGYLVTGQKVWTSRAQFADRCYLLVQTSATERRHHNLSVLLLDMHQPNVKVVPIRQIIDVPEFNEVYFDEAYAADDELLGTENEGWRLGALSGARSRRRIFDALRWSVQIEQTMHQLDKCTRHGRSPQKARAAHLGTRVELLRHHIVRTVETMTAGRSWEGPASVLRMFWTGLWQEIAECGVDTWCGEHESYWRYRYLETRSVTIHGGTAQIQRNVVADRVLELPRDEAAGAAR